MEQVGLVVKQLDNAMSNGAIDSQSPKFIVSPGLLSVLKAEGAQGELFTKKEIMNYLRSYICNRVLYDNDNPTTVHCENDPLGHALGVKQFTVSEAMALLSAKVRLATPPQKGHVLSPGLCNFGVGEKRRSSDLEDESSLKRHCAEVLDRRPPMALAPLVYEICEAPDYDSSPETVFSFQGYETSFAIDVKESSDDLWFLETEEEYEVEIETDNFEVEYEVNSLANSSAAEDNVDDTDSESDVALQEMVGAALLVCQNDSDVEFWADSDCDSVTAAAVDEQSTSESDPEITDGDKWKCLGCQAFNRPLLRFCQKCWRLRSDWLPDHYRRRRPQRENVRRRRRRADLRRTLSAPDEGHVRQLSKLPRHRKTSRSMIDVSISIESDGDSSPVSSASPAVVDSTATTKTTAEYDAGVKSEGDVGGSTQGTSTIDESSPPQVDAGSASASSMCSICLSRPKNASIIHGKIGHQMCCYSCGKKLWARNKPCPICRRTIQKVIHNYIV